jgi:hypothetical protein
MGEHILVAANVCGQARPLDEFVAAPQRAEHTGCLPGTANSGRKEGGRPDRHCLLAGLAVGQARRAQLRRIWSRYAGLLAGPVKLGPRPPSRRLMPRFGTGSPGQDSSGLRQGSGRGRRPTDLTREAMRTSRVLCYPICYRTR